MEHHRAPPAAGLAQALDAAMGHRRLGGRAVVHSRVLEEQMSHEKQEALVKDTVARLGCSAETAQDMIGQCNARLEEIDIDLTFAGLAHDVWAGRAGRGAELTPLVEALMAEQLRHAEAMQALGQRFHAIAQAEHEHLADDAVDADYVRRTLLTPPEEPRWVVRQKTAD